MVADASLPPFDLDKARAQTPGCTKVLHLNNAGASLPPNPVLEAQINWLREEAVLGGYEIAKRRERDIERSYSELARLIGARPSEIALVENATFAWHQAFWSLPLRPGERVLVGRSEYASSFISYLQAQVRRGLKVEVIPDDASGQTSVAALADMLDAASATNPVGLVAMVHVPTNGGLVNPAAEIGQLTRAAGVPYLLDACQSVGQLRVDVDEIGCDLLSATGRKFLRAPRGTGFLYVRSSLLDRLEPAFVDLRGAEWIDLDRYELRPDARRFENWEFSFAGVIGLCTAASYAQSWGIEAIEARVCALGDELRTRLSDIAGVRVHDLGQRRCGIVTFTKRGVEAHEIRAELASRGMNVSVSEPSSTLLDAEERGLPNLVRASVHYYNSLVELGRFVTAVDSL